MIDKYNNNQRSNIPTLPLVMFTLFLAGMFGFITASLAEVYPKSGIVITRGLVLGPNDKPIYAEIAESGEFVNDIGEAVGEYAKAHVISGDTYRGLYDHYQQTLQAHADDQSYRGAKVMTAEEYKTTELGKVKVPKANWDGNGESFTEVEIPKIDLPDSIKSVLVRDANTIVDPDLLPQADGSILFRSIIDLRKGVLKDLSEDIKSVLIGDKGEVLYSSANNIGFKAAFYTDSEGNPHDSIRRDPAEDTILGPVSGAKVEPSMGYSMGPAYTDEDGKFWTNFYVVPCPGFSYDHHFYFEGELLYRNYDPEAPNPIGQYFFKRDYYHFCSGYHLVAPGYTLGGLMAQVEAIGIHASMAIPYNPVEIYVDVVQLGGIGQLIGSNGIIPVGDTTEYEYVAPPGTKVAPTNLDLDNDRNYDTVTGTADGNVGVYLGDKQPVDANGQPVDPDLVKVADTMPDWKNQGLLKGISRDDFKETDLYFYRVSNGTLITKIEGLEHPYKSRDPKKVEISKDGKSFNYRVRIPGEWATKNTWSFLTGTREEWQEALETPPELSGREFDALRPGEEVKIIAINRPTGYIGTQTTTIQPAGGGFLDFYIPPINMYAPNLKIQAERVYTVEAGLTKDEKRDYTIGFEGSALTSDTMISIKTEWFDHDGTPLPEDLEGYTGRLAKVVSENSVEGGEVQQFKIEPGEHLEVLKFKGDVLGTEHFYVHVSGYPEWRSAGVGAGDGPLQYRPKNYVPFLVPFFDEGATTEERNKARYAREDEISDIKDVDPIYHWFYRPEMQFSVYELLVKEINRTISDDEGSYDILSLGRDNDKNTVPIIGTSDQLVELLYSLTSSQFPMLQAFGAGRELIFAIGESELKAQVAEDGSLIFDDIEHLLSLQPEDYLTIRLFENGDTENTLWEFAFEALYVMPQRESEYKVLTADEPTMDVLAFIPGYSSKEDVEKQEYKVTWKGSDVSFSPSVDSSTEGIFASTATFPRTADKEYYYDTYLGKVQDAAKVPGAKVKIIAGKPKLITVASTSGKTAIAGLGGINLIARIQDEWGNDVEDGTAVQISSDSDIAIDSTYKTEGGYVQFQLAGLETDGVKNLTITAGEVEKTTSVQVDNIDLSISVPPSIPLQSSVDVQISATSPAGPVTDVTALLWVSKGQLASQAVNFVNGVSTVKLDGGVFAGPGVFKAQVSESSYSEQSYYVGELPGSGGAPKVSVPLIMGDKTTSGTITYANVEDQDYTFDYAASSTVTVYGNPGETVPVEIGSLYKPFIEPVLEYQLGVLGEGNQVYDRYDVIHGTATNVSVLKNAPDGINGAYQFQKASGSVVRIPNHSALDISTGVGFSVSVKPTESDSEIVAYDLRKQSLDLVGGKYRYTVTTSDGTFFVESDASEIGAWNEVAVRYQNGMLTLEVDGAVFESPATGELLRQTSTTAIRLGVDFSGSVSEFRVIDWSYPELAKFSNGKSSAEVIIGSDGTGTIELHSTGQMGRAMFAAIESSGFDIAGGFFIRNAYADDGAGGSPGFWGWIKSGTQKVATGITTTAQSVVAFQEGLARGIFMGDTSTPQGAAADFLIGFIPFVGDGRDIALQKYWELTKDARHDELVVTLAYIGLAADAASAVGVIAVPVTGGGSLAVTVIGQIFKAAAKTLKVVAHLIPKGPFRKTLVNVLQESLVLAKKGNWNKLSNTLNVIGLITAVAGNETLRELMIGAIQTPEDFFNWSDYLGEYAGIYGDGVSKVDGTPDSIILDFFIKPAYAGSSWKELLTSQLDNLVTFATKNNLANGLSPSRQVGRFLSEAIGILKKSPDHIVEGAKFKQSMLNSLIAARRYSPEKGMEGIILAAKSRVGKYADFLDNFSSVVNKIAKNDKLDEGFKRVINDLSSTWPKRQGAVHHIRMLDKESGVIKSIEETVEVVYKTGRKYKRRYDAIVERAGKIIHQDAKSWAPEFAKKNLVNSILGGPINNRIPIVNEAGEVIGDMVKDLAAEQGGQLLTDLVQAYAKKDTKEVIEWVFDKRSIDHIDEYVEVVKDALKGRAGEKVREALNMDPLKWKNEGLKELTEIVSNGFFRAID